jgi:hypothetical protein
MMVDTKNRRGIPAWVSPKFALFSALIFVAACSTDSCSCEGFEPGTFPAEHYDKTLPSGGQLRVTQSGFDFIEDEVPTLIGQFQPGGLSFCVPPSEGTADICTGSTCTDGSNGCQLDLAIDDAQITPQPSDTLMVDITVGQIGGEDANGDAQDVIDVHMWGVDCELIIFDKSGDKADPAEIRAQLPITFSIDEQSPTRDVRIEIGEVLMADFTDQVEYDLEGNFLCTMGSWVAPLFNGTINNQIKDQLTTAIDGIKAEQLCRACGGAEPACPGNSTCGDNGGVQSCMYPSGECVPRTLGMEGKLMLGQLIGDYSQNPTAEVDILAKVADMATVDTGLNLGLRIGAQPTSFGRCVPVDPTVRPGFDAIPPSAELLADTTPAGDPFMLGIGLHERALEHMLWSIWGGGALCMKVDGSTVSQLSTTTLGALIPSIRDLAGSGAMALLQIAPQTPPEVELGANTVVPDGDSYVIDDALIDLTWKDLDLHFYVYANERYVRAFSLRADLVLPIALASDGQGSIIPVLGDLEGAVQNIRPVKTRLLKPEEVDSLIDLIPSLISMALPSLAGSISQPIDLPEVFGYRISLEQEDITSVDNNTMIALYADLVPVAQPIGIPLNTLVVGTQVDLSEWTDSGVPRPVAIVDVMADLPDFVPAGMSADVEYSWRVDGGIWSMYHRAERLEVQSPMLVLEGRHRIEIRARFRGEVGTTEITPATTHVLVDYSAPRLRIERSDAIVSLVANDTVDANSEMKYRYRIVDGSGEGRWTRWSSAASIDLREVGAPEHFRLIAQVRDRAGHVTEDEQNVVWDSRESALGGANSDSSTPANEAQAGGCSAAGGQSPMGPLAGLIFVLGGLFMLRRRRGRRTNRALFVALSMIAAFGLGACDEDAANQDVPIDESCDPACAANEICVEGACQLAEGACSTVEDCAECELGEVPVCQEDGMCGCVASCDEGCGENQFCCFGTNACQDLPDPCADQVCDPGFQPSAVSLGTGDSATCEVSGQVCECVALPPLPLGVHGLYASVAQQGEVRAASVYNKTYTDLMVATVDSSGAPTWYFVDGLPEGGDIEGAIDGPRGGVYDRGPDVGTHTAIGVDAQGGLHVLYRDEDNGALKYARGTKSSGGYDFALKTLNDEGDSGYYPSVLIVDGTLHAVYSVNNFDDPTEGWQTQLRYINFPVDAPLDQLAPAAEIVAASPTANPCGGSCIGSEVCVTSGAAACVIPSGECGSCGDGLECIEGVCETIYVEQLREYPLMVGVFSQLSKTADGLALTFYDHLRREVGWAKRSGGAWGAAEYLGAPSGPYVSGAFDADGRLHLAYMEPTSQDLIYEVVGQGVREVVARGVRDTVDGYVLADIGEDVELRLNADGSVQVLYQDATWHKLMLATRDSAGAWSSTTLGEPGEPYTGAHGFFAAMIRNPDSSALAVEFVLNPQTEPTTGTPVFHSLP